MLEDDLFRGEEKKKSEIPQFVQHTPSLCIFSFTFNGNFKGKYNI